MEYPTNEEFEIGDVESYGTQKDQGFSHQGLVMTSIRRALENGSKEMKPGWIQEKIDRNGNRLRTHIDDTRKAFIESVESCIDIMECDFDEEAEQEIKSMIELLEKRRIELIKLEDEEWDNLLPIIKRRMLDAGKGNIRGYLDKEKRFYQMYLDESVKVYRKILRALSKLTKRLDFYKAEIIEG